MARLLCLVSACPTLFSEPVSEDSSNLESGQNADHSDVPTDCCDHRTTGWNEHTHLLVDYIRSLTQAVDDGFAGQTVTPGIPFLSFDFPDLFVVF